MRSLAALLALPIWRHAAVRSTTALGVCCQPQAGDLRMTNSNRHPDLLRRFIPTPYVFSKCDGTSRCCVESNDLEIALGVWYSDLIHRQGNPAEGLLCKIIRDKAGPVDGS